MARPTANATHLLDQELQLGGQQDLVFHDQNVERALVHHQIQPISVMNAIDRQVHHDAGSGIGGRGLGTRLQLLAQQLDDGQTESARRCGSLQPNAVVGDFDPEISVLAGDADEDLAGARPFMASGGKAWRRALENSSLITRARGAALEAAMSMRSRSRRTLMSSRRAARSCR
jgi:hypothetical protein